MIHKKRSFLVPPLRSGSWRLRQRNPLAWWTQTLTPAQMNGILTVEHCLGISCSWLQHLKFIILATAKIWLGEVGCSDMHQWQLNDRVAIDMLWCPWILQLCNCCFTWLSISVAVFHSRVCFIQKSLFFVWFRKISPSFKLFISPSLLISPSFKLFGRLRLGTLVTLFIFARQSVTGLLRGRMADDARRTPAAWSSCRSFIPLTPQ